MAGAIELIQINIKFTKSDARCKKIRNELILTNLPRRNGTIHRHYSLFQTLHVEGQVPTLTWAF